MEIYKLITLVTNSRDFSHERFHLKIYKLNKKIVYYIKRQKSPEIQYLCGFGVIFVLIVFCRNLSYLDEKMVY